MADPPITPPVDSSVIPVVPTEFTSPQPAIHALQRGVLNQVNDKIRLYVKATRHWEVQMGQPLSQSSYRAISAQSVTYATWVLKLWKARAKQKYIQAQHWMVRQTLYFKQNIRHWTLVMGKNPLASVVVPLRQLSGSPGIEAQFNHWSKANAVVMQEVENPPHSSQFDCIHHYEGSWTANTGNGYYGGLQMDLGFQTTYGGYLLHTKGTADNWTPEEQKLVALRAYNSGRGFGPWPNTARACGLL